MLNKFFENSKVFNEFINVTKEFNKFSESVIPLCAAENRLSPFARLPLSSDMQERYIMGGMFNYDINKNFIGSEYLLPFYKLINRQCNILFGSSYADARTLSGMNSITTVLMSLFNQDSTIMLSMPECGGHPSLPEICRRLGLRIIPIPYNYEMYDFDYVETNKILKKKNIDAIVLVTSDIICPPKINHFIVPENTLIIYDATQTLGLISGGVIGNPINQNENIILTGGTHKTLPGPTCGLILTKNEEIARKLDSSINPKFIRNTQMHQILSLLLTLIEMEFFGKEYAAKIVENANILGKALEDRKFNVAAVGNKYSYTHQLFIHTSKNDMDYLFRQAIQWGITLNKKEKKLFRNYGIRLGVQEISRYNWGYDELLIVAKIFDKIMRRDKDEGYIQKMINSISNKKILHYAFSNEVVTKIRDKLQKN